jgi:hypothetical protein
MPDIVTLLKSLPEGSEPWPIHLDLAESILNDTICRTTGLDPFSLLHGRPRRSSLLAAVGLPAPEPAEPWSPARHAEGLLAIQQLALAASSAAQLSSIADRQSSPTSSFTVGQHVLLLSDTPDKLTPVGDVYVVRKVAGPSHYVISQPWSPLDTRVVPPQRLRLFDASRADLAEMAISRLATGYRIIADVVSHQKDTLGTITLPELTNIPHRLLKLSLRQRVAPIIKTRNQITFRNKHINWKTFIKQSNQLIDALAQSTTPPLKQASIVA